MAQVSFEISALYGRVWGGLVFPELLRRANSVEDFFFKDKKEALFPATKIGRPIQSELTLRFNNEDLKFTIPPIITLAGSINVIETVVAGLDGSIKEVASVNDYVLNIKGFLTSTVYTDVQDDQSGFSYRLNPNEFPEKEFRQLRRFFEAKQSLEVVESRLLSYFNIKKILVKSINYPELEGYTFIVPFELECVSDVDFKLIIE